MSIMLQKVSSVMHDKKTPNFIGNIFFFVDKEINSNTNLNKEEKTFMLACAVLEVRRI